VRWRERRWRYFPTSSSSSMDSGSVGVSSPAPSLFLGPQLIVAGTVRFLLCQVLGQVGTPQCAVSVPKTLHKLTSMMRG
jgi:hypothetical protein